MNSVLRWDSSDGRRYIQSVAIQSRVEERIMASSFPGMDPFIESQLWEDFHGDMIPVIRTRDDRRVATVMELLSSTNKDDKGGRHRCWQSGQTTSGH
jgi:hypothetical protein